MTTLDVVVPGAANSVRSDHHPVLEPGSRAFPQGCYRLTFEQTRSPESDPSSDEMTFTLCHHIENAPFITRLVKAGQAEFACIVAAPRSSYRKLHRSPRPEQAIACHRADLGEPPLFTPLVVCTDQVELTLDADRDGVNEIWQDQTITLHKGQRLAIGSIIRLETSMTHLLSMQADDTLEPGQFIVEERTEPYQFSVKVHPDLHRFLRYKSDQSDQSVRHNIIVHIVTACLALLQREWKEGDDDKDWESVPHLKAFAAYLEAKGIRHWTDEDFRPEEAATRLYPLEVPKAGETVG